MEGTDKNPEVLQYVEGVNLPFVANPKQNREPKSLKFSKIESCLISGEVQEMLDKKAIEVVKPVQDQFVGQIFLRAKQDVGHRLLFNMKELNQFLEYLHFKMETMKDLINMLKPGDYMAKIDLKDAYFSVPMSPNSKKCMRFQWKDVLYQFRVMAFGLGPAPRIFTKLLKPVIALLRRLGMRLMIFLDDLIFLNQDPEELLKDLKSVCYLLMSLGFTINWKKTITVPTQRIEYLGFNIDSIRMEISLPQDKVKKSHSGLQRDVTYSVPVSSEISKIDRNFDLNGDGSSTGPVALQKAANGCQQSFDHGEVVRGDGMSDQGSLGGDFMVDSIFGNIEREIVIEEYEGSSDHQRC